MKIQNLNLKVDDIERQIFGFDSDYISTTIERFGCWEPNNTRFFIDRVTSNEFDSFIDIGAYIGYYSIIWDVITNSKPRLSIEANPYSFTLLSHNLNGRGCQNRFVSAGDYMANLVINWSNIGGTKQSNDIEDISIRTTSVSPLTDHTLFKIDVEGNELDVVRDLYKNQVLPKGIIIEITPFFSKEKAKETLELLEQNYTLFDLGCKERGFIPAKFEPAQIQSSAITLKMRQVNLYGRLRM